MLCWFSCFFGQTVQMVKQYKQGSYPIQRQFSRTFPGLLQDSDRFFQVSQMNNNWRNKPLWNRNPKIILQPIRFKPNFLTRVYRFQGLSRTLINFPGLSSPGKCQNKIPGLSRIFSTRTNPVHKLLPGQPTGQKYQVHRCFKNEETTITQSSY